MITRHLISHAKKSDTSDRRQSAGADADQYSSPKAVKVGRAQELLQGSFEGNMTDSWSSNYWRTYPG